MQTYKLDQIPTEAKESMMNEVKILKKLDHPSIRHIYECFQNKNQYSIIFGLCKGGELFDELYNTGALSESMTITIIKEVLRCIAYCHANNIMHRDIKAENILLDNSGGYE